MKNINYENQNNMSKIKLFSIFLFNNIVFTIIPIIFVSLFNYLKISTDVSWYLLYLLIIPLLINIVILFKFRLYNFSYILIIFFIILSYMANYFISLNFISEAIKNTNFFI